MKRFFVIECDTEFYSVYVYEVQRRFTEKVVYEHEACAEMAICGPVSPKFYGQLDRLLVTKASIAEASPITPEAPVEEVKP